MNQTSHGSGSGGIVNSYNVNSYNHNTIADDKPQVLQWLSPLKPQERHQQICDNRHEGVGEWIFEREEFVKWRTEEDGAHPVIFCEGDPGVGKTHLSSLVMDRLRDEAIQSRRNIKVIGLYCDYLDREGQSVRNLLGALLKQVICIGEIPEDIRQVFEATKGSFSGAGPRLPQLRQMLKTAIASQEQVLICIDAIDEASPEHRVDLLDALREISRESPSVRIFLTGRPFVRSDVEMYFPGVQVISVSPTTDDIKIYLTRKLDKDTLRDAMDDRLREDILRIISARISEIFLLVSLSVETILGETTISKRRKRLNEMTKQQNVGDVYATTLERIKAQNGSKSQLAMDALMWMSHSEERLAQDELCEALGVEFETPDLDIDNVPSIRTIVECSLGLITVDSRSSTIRLVHFTLQEYLCANPTLFHSPHSKMAEVCLTYLNFDSIRNLSPTLRFAPPTTPFLYYASCHWGIHARKETTERVIPLALRLLDKFDDHISSKLLILGTIMFDHLDADDFEDVHEGFTGLHGASYFGIEGIMVALLQIKEWDINAIDKGRNTALGWAVAEGHDGVVEILLGRNDLDPNIANFKQRTPLFQAAKRGDEHVVKILLDRNDINPEMADYRDRTPLLQAARYGHTGVVETLLDRSDVNPDAADRDGQTLLSWAARQGKDEIVERLLSRNDVNPDMADKSGRTPLSWAAGEGQEGIVKRLLSRNDVNPDIADNSGRTPLSWAAQKGGDEIVEGLLSRNDVNPDMADGDGRTPLSWAVTRYGKGSFAEMFLPWSDVNPETADNSGRTPLAWAVTRYGNDGVAEMFLSRSDVNPETADNSGRTPLSWAAEKGGDKIVERLLSRSDVNPDMADGDGRTPLSWAVTRYGNGSVAEMFLSRSDVNPETADNSGRTPLSWAAEKGKDRVVEMFLSRSIVNPETADKSGRTPLSWAAETGEGRVVEIFLSRSDVNPETADTYGRTPLSWAAQNGHEGVRQILSERHNANPTCANDKQPDALAINLLELPGPPSNRIRRS